MNKGAQDASLSQMLPARSVHAWSELPAPLPLLVVPEHATSAIIIANQLPRTVFAIR
jgi:hypothetical protein